MYLTEGRDRQFEIYKTGIEAPGFRDYHEKLQTFILFFIDAASFIDVDDERWQFFLLYVVHNIENITISHIFHPICFKN